MSVVTPLPSDDPPPSAPARPSLLRRLVRFGAALSLLCAAASFPSSALFDLESVSVAGNVAVASSEVLDRAGLRPGLNAFRVNAGFISKRLREDPRIQDVAVTMIRFPSQVRVAVVERTPAAALAVDDGYVHVSADGVALTAESDPGRLPLLIVDRLNPADVAAGRILDSADARLGARIAGSLPAAVRERIAGVHVDRAGEATLVLQSGVAVRLGGGAGIAERLGMVSDVLDAIATRGLVVEMVDLRIPGNVVVRPLGAPGASPGGRQEKTPPRGIEPALHRPSFP